MLFWILLITHIIFAFSTSIVIILYGVRPTRSFSWLLLVIFFPFVGVIFYLLLGINRRKFKFFKLKETSKRELYNKTHENSQKIHSGVNFESINKQRLANLIEKTTHFAVVPNNKVDVLDEPAMVYQKIFKDLRAAKHYIHLQYYILEKGDILNELFEILKLKLKEGLEVRLIYDALGSYSLKNTLLKDLENEGAKVFPVMPLKYGSFLFNMNYRNHRKSIIIDGQIGFAGGMNISDKYIKEIDNLGIWKDMHLRMEGLIINNLHRVFIKDYYFASDEKLLIKNTYLPQQPKAGNTNIQLVASGPDSNHLSVLQQYLMLINVAQKSVCITNPYFIPNQALLESIKMASLSGVTVRILVPEKTDSKMATYSMFSFFEELILAGVEIYLLTSEFTHSKVIIVDQEVASIGSGNFDHRSFEHNFETNVLIYEKTIAEKLHNSFTDDCKKSNKINLETFKKRGLKQKLLEGSARFFSPLL